LTRYINVRRKNEEDRRKEEAHKKAEEEARKKADKGQSSNTTIKTETFVDPDENYVADGSYSGNGNFCRPDHTSMEVTGLTSVSQRKLMPSNFCRLRSADGS
jgi:hypothetical protein